MATVVQWMGAPCRQSFMREAQELADEMRNDHNTKLEESAPYI